MDRKEPFLGNTYSWLNSFARTFLKSEIESATQPFVLGEFTCQIQFLRAA